MDPKTGLPQGANEEAIATNTTGGAIVLESHADTAMCATNVVTHTREVNAPCSSSNQQTMKSQPQNAVSNPQSPNASKDVALPTPVSVKNLEVALSGHPDQNFVLRSVLILSKVYALGFRGNALQGFQKICLLLRIRIVFLKFGN